MCENGKCCEKSEELKGRPQDCTPEQIEKCHGDVEEHPCAPKKKAYRTKGKN